MDCSKFEHVPVLFDEVIEGLNIKSDGIYVDLTLGGAGHSSGIVDRLETGRLIGVDQDADAIEEATKKLSNKNVDIVLVRSNFERFELILDELDIELVDGVLMDIGVSSHQFDEADRGFSYRFDAPLDMRMDTRQDFTAKILVNTYSEEEIRELLYKNADERWAARIAEFIVKARVEKEICTTLELVEIIKNAIPLKARKDGGHPAKKTFQAIRIEVNRELERLEKVIEKIVDRLNVGGRLAIITFHSIEDRIVKKKMKYLSNPCACPSDFPVCVCGAKPKVKVVTRKPVVASVEELELNSRAKSAKLRIAERI